MGPRSSGNLSQPLCHHLQVEAKAHSSDGCAEAGRASLMPLPPCLFLPFLFPFAPFTFISVLSSFSPFPLSCRLLPFPPSKPLKAHVSNSSFLAVIYGVRRCPARLTVETSAIPLGRVHWSLGEALLCVHPPRNGEKEPSGLQCSGVKINVLAS